MLRTPPALTQKKTGPLRPPKSLMLMVGDARIELAIPFGLKIDLSPFAAPAGRVRDDVLRLVRWRDCLKPSRAVPVLSEGHKAAALTG